MRPLAHTTIVIMAAIYIAYLGFGTWGTWELGKIITKRVEDLKTHLPCKSKVSCPVPLKRINSKLQ